MNIILELNMKGQRRGMFSERNACMANQYSQGGRQNLQSIFVFPGSSLFGKLASCRAEEEADVGSGKLEFETLLR